MRYVFATLLMLAAGSGADTASATDQHATEAAMNKDMFSPDDFSWSIINDGVMGGKSQSRISRSGTGTWIFAGHLSLENNGGFASIRSGLKHRDLSGYDGISLRVLGDGRPYRLRLRTNDSFDGVAYQATFATTRDRWVEVHIPFTAFKPFFRGRTVPGAAPLDTANVCQLGFMIADKTQAEFRLEIEWIRLMKSAAGRS